MLPSDPVLAKITTMTTSQPQLATPETLALIECTIYPHINETGKIVKGDGRHATQMRSVAFRTADGYVQLASSSSRFWIGGYQIDSVECR